jgi:hypothetical protein
VLKRAARGFVAAAAGDSILAMRARTVALVISVMLFLCFGAGPANRPAQDVTFNTNFEDASLGRIDVLSPTSFRCAVQGQYDQRGHNRQASWYYFRIDHARGRDLTLTLTDFVGEYNDKPGAVAMGPGIIPVFSDDGRHWQHIPESAVSWDAQKKELTLTLHPQADSIYIAHVVPYTTSDLKRLLDEIDRSPYAIVETIGKSAGGRDLYMVTVTDPSVPDAGKKVVWLQARQHAWEAGTSYVAQGAMRFAVSDDPAAVELRKKVVFKFTPMVDPDGCATGKVRFNANGYDVNRRWAEVDLRDKRYLRLMPEIWYTKKAIVGAGRIDLMVNLHNTETGEYPSTHADDPRALEMMGRFFDLLVERTSFDPSKKLELVKTPDDTNSLFDQHHIPVMLMEQRIATGKKLGRPPTVEDRLKFGRDLLATMAGAVLK